MNEFAATVTVLMLAWGSLAPAEEFHVSNAGDDAAPGTIAEPFATLTHAVSRATAGDAIRLERGGRWRESPSLDVHGTPERFVTLGAYGTGNPPVVFALTVRGNHTRIENIVVDHEREESDAVRIRDAKGVVLTGLEVLNGGRDGIDADRADGLRIERVHVHHFLAGSYAEQFDAHGIVTSNTSALRIRHAEIHHVSGDSFQTDPDRDTIVSSDIVIEDSHFWTGPLASDFNLWKAGEIPGENAVDTKNVMADWDAAPRMNLTFRNITAHGWTRGYIGNRAAFNLKEKVRVHFDGVTVYDNEIAFRIRGARGNAQVTLVNAVIHDNEKAVRAEDDLTGLVILNSTFGRANRRLFQIVSGDRTRTWRVLNSAFLGAKPGVAAHPSNLAAAPTDFLDADGNDYRPAPGSRLIDRGVPLHEVPSDREANPRPRGRGQDVGAYEAP